MVVDDAAENGYRLKRKPPQISSAPSGATPVSSQSVEAAALNGVDHGNLESENRWQIWPRAKRPLIVATLLVLGGAYWMKEDPAPDRNAAPKLVRATVLEKMEFFDTA